jgi:hypothetical protein
MGLTLCWILSFLAFALLSGGMLNYLDTGNIFKILPDCRLRFFGLCLSVGCGLATVITVFMMAPN